MRIKILVALCLFFLVFPSFVIRSGAFAIGRKDSVDAGAFPRDGRYVIDGYGYAVSIEGSKLSLFDCSSMSRLLFLHGKIDDVGRVKLLPEGGLGMAALLTDNAIEASLGADAISFLGNSYRLTPVGAFPDVPVTRKTKNVSVNYEVFCRYIAEYSVAFPHRPALDWTSLCERNRDRASRADEKELFAICAEMIQSLNDGHTTLSAESLESCSVPPSAFESDIADKGALPFRDTVMNRLENIGRGKTRRIVWGTIKGTRCGYLLVTGLADMTKKKSSYEEELAAVSSDAETSARYLSQLDSVILDLRINGGGNDEFGEKIVSIFIGEKILACSVQHRKGEPGNWSERELRYLEPGPVNCASLPLAVLVSPLTASAAEVLALPLLHRPAATVIGERTSGCFSDMLVKTLPNGWTLTLSNERYLDGRGVDREQLGIDPDIPAPVRYDDFVAGRDLAVESALQFFASREDDLNSTGDMDVDSRKNR